MRRVVITGMGAITPVGLTMKDTWAAIKAGKHGFARIQAFDPTALGVTIGAEVKGFDPQDFGVNKKEARRMDRFCQLAMAAANMAMEDVGTKFEDLDPFRVGVIVGSGIGGFNTIHQEHTKYMEKGPSKVSVFFIPMIISNMAAGMISIQHKFKGANFCTTTACASGSHAIGEAFRAIRHGYLDAAVTGGSEASVAEFSMAGFANMGALSTSADPDRASIPFDKERNGFVLGEGAGILVLEEYEHALKRGAKIYAEIAGYGATGDAYHITSPDPDGAGAAKAMEFAMEEAGVKPEEIDYINAHGTSTQLNDSFETKAVKTALGDHAYHTAISSTKSMTGHLLGAAGAVEAAITALSLKESVIPQTVGFRIPDPECDLDYVTEGLRHQDIRCALSNSLGFGGHNATLCLKKAEG